MATENAPLGAFCLFCLYVFILRRKPSAFPSPPGQNCSTWNNFVSPLLLLRAYVLQLEAVCSGILEVKSFSDSRREYAY